MNCPICTVELQKGKCPKCDREWILDHSGNVTSKRRKVKIVKPIREGEMLDDCIKPADSN